MHKVGTLAISRGNGKLFIIKRVIDIKQDHRKRTRKLQGYRVSLCEQIDIGFVVNATDFDNRFKVVS